MKNNSENSKCYNLSVSLGKKESDIIEELKKSPYFINISELVRDFIVEYYNRIKSEKHK
jgi:Arc/MetJ-type ribon-helix-helix transcriptional regulator